MQEEQNLLYWFRQEMLRAGAGRKFGISEEDLTW
jgi:hypothetical protein